MSALQPQLLLKNRRSSSITSTPMISEQLSKRSSISVLAPFGDSDNAQSSSFNNHNNFTHQKQRQKQRQFSQYKKEKCSPQILTVTEQLINKLKRQLIQPYRIVKKHVKQNSLIFLQSQLKQVYQGMSNGLKSVQRLFIKLTQQHLSIQHSNDIYRNPNHNSSMLTTNVVNCTSHHQNTSQIMAENKQKLQARVQQLEKQIQTVREHHNQQIRFMMATHQEEMMFVQEDCKIRLEAVKKQAKIQVEEVKRKLGQREEQIKVEVENSISQIFKIKMDTIIEEQRARDEQLRKSFEEKQNSYRLVVKTLLSKLTEAKQTHQALQQSYAQSISKCKSLLRRISTSTNHKHPNNQKQTHPNQSFLTLLSNKLQSLTTSANNYSPLYPLPQNHSTIPSSQTNPYSTITIEQMFMKNDESLMVQNDFQLSLQRMMERLVMMGFFCQENEDNIVRLFGVVRETNRIEEGDGGDGVLGVLGHTLYPLMLQKIKLTIAHYNQPSQTQQLYQNHLSKQNHLSNQSKLISEFNQQSLNKRQYHQVHYRNIGSIQELDVSDSMIVDDSQRELDEGKEKDNGEDGDDYEERGVSYCGYESDGDGSGSFEVEMF